MESTTKKKKTRKSLTIEQKADIVKKLTNGIKIYQICQEYEISSSTVSTIFKQKESIDERYKELKLINGTKNWKRNRDSKFKDLENTLFAWLSQKRAIGEPVSGILLQEKAKWFYTKMKEGRLVPDNEPDFKASAGWLSKFKTRFGLRTLQLKGEKASADREASDLFIQEFAQFCLKNNYCPENIYNADETGLQYRSLPQQTLVLATEREVAAHKPMKDRLTIMVCSNASGSHKIPLLVIGKSATPRCFKNNQIPLLYQGQKKAWMNSKIFLDWFRNIFLKNVRALKPDERILLLLDNAPTHPSEEILNVIDDKCVVKYLPPNVTSLIQPMDQGVISAMKRHYKTGFLRELLSQNHDNQSDVVSFVKKWTVLNCMHVLKEAWTTLTLPTLKNSWKKLMPNMTSAVATDSTPNSNNELVQLLNRVPGGNVCSSTNVTNWLQEEQSLPVFEVFSDEQLLNTYAALPLPLISAEQNEETSVEESDEETEIISFKSPKDILKAAQDIVNWTRGRTDFTEEECLVFVKARDLALSLLKENC